jgi:hypothetical protein
MNKLEALRYYKKMDKAILKHYEDADKYQWYNVGDVDLHPIRTELPKPPEWDKIDNFGLPKHRQVFIYEEIPSTLTYLVKKIKLDIKRDKSLTSEQKREEAFYDRIWDELENSTRYKKTLEWISDQWYYRINGKWVFINGKPTYLAPNFWFYLNYWHVEGVGRPEYRERDREWFYAMYYFKNDTTVPKKNENGDFLYNDDGSLQLEDVGYRTVEGVIVAKGRRAGDTTKATNDIYCDTTLMIDANCGIQGDKEATGEQVFNEKLMYAFRRLPFFWKPKLDYNVQSALIFESKDVEESLNSKIDYGSANPTQYDGRKLYRYYADEPGKIERYSVDERHNIVRLCLRLGTKLIGFSIYTTTVNDMSSDSGRNFERLCRDSFYEERTESGSTKSGMVFIHFPADHGCEGFIGKYGESVKEKPTEEQLKHIDNRKNSIGEHVGAREFILMQREAYRIAGQHEKVAQEKRLRPLTFAESFAPPANNVFFNMDILETRYTELKRRNDLTIRGNFVGDPNDAVTFMPDKDGRFYVSRLLPIGMSNKKYKRNDSWYPMNPNIYVASADVFKNDRDRMEGWKGSDGGGAVLWLYDPRVDPEGKAVEEWESGIFVCTYRYRPDTTDEYCLDMLRMCVYFGALMYPENNLDLVWKYFVSRGFSGYLLYDTDPDTGRPKAKPGFHSGGDMKTKLFNLTRNYVATHGSREKHIDYIDECLNIRNQDEMTRYDLLTACGGCLLGAESSYGEYLQEPESIDIDDLLW